MEALRNSMKTPLIHPTSLHLTQPDPPASTDCSSSSEVKSFPCPPNHPSPTKKGLVPRISWLSYIAVAMEGKKKKRNGKAKSKSHRSLCKWLRDKRGEKPTSARSKSSVQAATGLSCDALSSMMSRENGNELANTPSAPTTASHDAQQLRSTGLQGVIEPTPVSDRISLWDRAYDALAAEDPKLVEEYNAVLCLPSGKNSVPTL